MHRETTQYLSPGNDISVDRKLRFMAIDRRKSRLKRISISPFHDHVEIQILHIFWNSYGDGNRGRRYAGSSFHAQ